jgi:hypothetical protein
MRLIAGSWDCFKRRALTSVLAFGLIIFSLIMIFSARYLEQVRILPLILMFVLILTPTPIPIPKLTPIHLHLLMEQINAKSAAGLCPADFGDYSKAEQQVGSIHIDLIALRVLLTFTAVK